MMLRGFILLCFAVMGSLDASAMNPHRRVGGGAVPFSSEEFVGPFPSWANVKTGYGAIGDGIADDTAAIRTALAALSPSNPTLYFPAGIYKITGQIALAGQIYVNIIGEDPATTTIIWAGPPTTAVFKLNGVAYSRVSRLTFDGANIETHALIYQSWDGVANYFDTGNEYSDIVLKNVAGGAGGGGIWCGYAGFGCAETSVLRSKFINLPNGIAMGNFNALDMFVWYSIFQNNGAGLTNIDGAGNFRAYNSLFQGSTVADISIGNTGLFSFYNNYSMGSQQFIGPSSGTNNPANITVQGNTILDTAAVESISIGNLGPIVLLNNTIRSLAGVTTGPVVVANGFSATDLFSMNNTFTASSPTYGSGHYHSVGDQVVPRSTVNPSPPILPGTPPNNHRIIFDVTPTGVAATDTPAVQSAVNSAVSAGNNAVVHLNPGSFSINATLTVAANSQIQIVGDGGYSRLIWVGSPGGQMLQLTGPSKVTLRDFAFSGGADPTITGVLVTNADQVGSRVFCEQCTVSYANVDFWSDSLDHTLVELHDFYHMYSSGAGQVGVKVTGGSSAAAGTWLGGALNIFNGASAGQDTAYSVSNGAHVLLRDIWYDAGAGGVKVVDLSGAYGTFTFSGAAVYLSAVGSNQIFMTNWQGTSALVNLSMNGNVSIGGTGSGANNLAEGLVGWCNTFFSDTTSPADTVGFLNGASTGNSPCATPPPGGQGSYELAETGSSATPFLNATLQQLLTTLPGVPATLPAGTTDVRMYRVFGDTAGIHVQH